MKRFVLLLALPFGCAATAAPQASVAPLTECGALKPVRVVELVAPIKSESHKFSFTRTVGAEATVAAEPGQSKAWVERAARCRLADPDVALQNADVRVLSVEGGYVIQLTSANHDTAREILTRAGRL